MDREEILAKSRAENLGSDEYEKQVLERAGRTAAQVGMLVCCAVALVSVATTGQTNAGCWIIYFTIHATLFWEKYRCLRRRHELTMAVVSTITGLFFVSIFILDLVKLHNG